MNELINRKFNGVVLTFEQAAVNSYMGINTVMKLAKESGALVKIGKIARVDWNRFYNYILSVYQVSE